MLHGAIEIISVNASGISFGFEYGKLEVFQPPSYFRIIFRVLF